MPFLPGGFASATRVKRAGYGDILSTRRDSTIDMALEEREKKDLLAPDIYGRRLDNRQGIRDWYLKERALKVVKALQKHGFDAAFAETKEEARERVLQMVPTGATVGCGGSITIRELGVPATLKERGHRMFDHWQPGLTAEQVLDIRRAQLTCDVFLTSANALTADGEIVSCDGAGNRVCAMTFGPKKVIIAIGVNKIVNTLQDALRRTRETAAPQALKDIGLNVPCEVTGSCQDCDSPRRGCRVTLILERKPLATDVTVLVIGQSLGF